MCAKERLQRQVRRVVNYTIKDRGCIKPTVYPLFAARVRLIVWCMDCRHQVEPDPAEMVQGYGAETPMPD
jgi:hypothetical protein